MTGPRSAASPAGSVVTVRGPIAPSSLGTTIVGEHLVASHATPDDSDAGWARIGRDRPRAATEVRFSRLPVTIATLGRLAMGAYGDDDLRLDATTATAGARAFAAAGGGAIVEVTVAGFAPDPAALARVAEHSRVHLVRAAGCGDPAWSARIEDGDVDSLAARLVAEVTAHRHPAGVIAAGLHEPADASSSARLEASGRAALATGAPLLLHLEGVDERLGLGRSAGRIPAGVRGAAALAAVERLLTSGLAPERIAVAGASALLAGGDAGADPAVLEALLDHGVRLLFDGLGRIPTVRTRVSDHDVATAVLGLAARGLADRVLLGGGIAQKHRLGAYGGNGYEFVPAQFAPYLGMLGADDALLHAVTAGNAARFLAFAEPEPAA